MKYNELKKKIISKLDMTIQEEEMNPKRWQKGQRPTCSHPQASCKNVNQSAIIYTEDLV